MFFRCLGLTLQVTLWVACGKCGSTPSEPEPVTENVAAPSFVVHEEPPAIVVPEAESAPRELVHRGGHVGWIHGAARSPDGELVALLSVDMPDMGQSMALPMPFATLTLIDTRTLQTRASWRFETPDTQGFGRVHFSRAGDRVMTEGTSFRAWDLRSGERTTLSSRGRGWMTPSPDGRSVADLFVPQADDSLPSESELEIRRTNDGNRLWSTMTSLCEAPCAAVAWHPFGDGRVALSEEDGVRLFGQLGREMAHDAIVPRSLHFRPSGGALYAEGLALALDPTTLRSLGRTPWLRIRSLSPDGLRLIGMALPPDDPQPHSSHALFHAETGERLGELPWPSDVDWDETEHSRRAFSFTPDGGSLWAVWHASAPTSRAPEGVVVPLDSTDGDTAADTGEAVDTDEGEEPWVEFLAFQSWNAADGSAGQTFYRSLSEPVPAMAFSPLGLEEVGPGLVATNDRLIVSLLRRVVVISHEGEVELESEDVGLESIITHAVEAPDGQGVALVSGAALGWFGANGGASQVCPDLLNASPDLRATGGAAQSFAQRYVCSTGEPGLKTYDAILGISQDGNTLVVAEGDMFSGEAEAWIVSGRRRVRLQGLRAWCQVDGCAVATFVPGDEYLVSDGELYRTRTGRVVRAIGEGTFSPDGTLIASREAVHELVTGRLVYDIEHAAPYERGVLNVPARFSPDSRFVAFVALREERFFVVVVDLEERRVLWEHRLDARPRQLWFNEEHVTLTTNDAQLHVFDASTGERASEALPVGRVVASATESRFAWCAGGRLHVLDAEPRELGRCVGEVLHVGRHFVVSADGGLAHVTRLTNGRTLRLRLGVEPYQSAWTLAEDMNGAWSLPPEVFGRYLLRGEGTLADATLSVVSEDSPGYMPDLVEAFFADVD